VCRLSSRGLVPDVLHPAVPVPSERELQQAAATSASILDQDLVEFIAEGPMLLSINRCVWGRGRGGFESVRVYMHYAAGL
jgi:hypothetical protein